jgi:DNA-binding NarL/FixJ family response regulator
LETVSKGERYLSPRITDVVIDDYVGKSTAAESAEGAKLTSRESRIVQLVAEGKTVKEIARVLRISPKTADTNRRQIMSKLGLSSVAELTKYAVREGLTSLEF